MRIYYTRLFLSLLFVPGFIECIKNRKDGLMRDRDSFLHQLGNKETGLRLTKSYQYQPCVDDLYASDLNNNLKIGEDEYVVFIAKRSHRAIVVDEYWQLPFPLISNFVYGSCFCSFVLQIPNCCVGKEAAIDLNPNESPFIEDNLITVCRTVDEAIINEIGTFAPTPAITIAITPQPSETPTLQTVEPSEAPTSVESENPTSVGSENPTSVGSGNPTSVGSGNPTSEPTDHPTTELITPTPTDQPTQIVSESPTESLTTSEPTTSPSTATPTMVLTNETATVAPSFSATTNTPTSQPTPDRLLCVTFQYGIENDHGYDAEDILNEVNNTYKSGLIIATRNATIQSLNESYPRDQEGGRYLQKKISQQQQQSSGRAIDRVWYENLGVTQPSIINDVDIIQQDERNFEHGYGGSIIGVIENDSTQVRRRAVFLPHMSTQITDSINNNKKVNDRRLAFYTDSYPPVINNIFDNAFCQQPEGIVCAVVDSSVCVMLEEGDDDDEVKGVLLNGIETSIQNGSFENVIHTENNKENSNERETNRKGNQPEKPNKKKREPNRKGTH